jgi:hypothetical protein
MLVAAVGTPDANALANALAAAGKRHGVLYRLVSGPPGAGERK